MTAAGLGVPDRVSPPRARSSEILSIQTLTLTRVLLFRRYDIVNAELQMHRPPHRQGKVVFGNGVKFLVASWFLVLIELLHYL